MSKFIGLSVTDGQKWYNFGAIYPGRVYFDISLPFTCLTDLFILQWAYPLLPWLNFKGMINNQAIFYPFILNIQNFLQNPQTVKNLSIFTLMCCF